MVRWRESSRCVSTVWEEGDGRGDGGEGGGCSWPSKGNSKKTVSSVSWEQQGKARREGKVGRRQIGGPSKLPAKWCVTEISCCATKAPASKKHRTHFVRHGTVDRPMYHSR